MTENETPLIRVWLRGKFQAELCHTDGRRQMVTNSEWASSYARIVFKRLLFAPGRRATRSDLIDDLWPGERESAEQLLYVACSRLRHIFGYKEIIVRRQGGYELAGSEIVQTDVDVSMQLIREAERLSLADSIPFLERAIVCFERGEILEGESGQWCIVIRQQQEKVVRSCHTMLAEAYEAQNSLWHAREQYQRLFEIDPLDEDALCRMLGMLHRHGLVSDLRTSYEEAQQRFEKEGISLSPSTQELFEHLRSRPIPFAFYIAPPRERSCLAESKPAEQPEPSLAPTFFVTYNVSSLSSSQTRLEIPELLMLQRRKFLFDLLNAASSSAIVSPYTLLSDENQEHLERMMAHPSYVDDEAIDALASTIQNFWDLRRKIAPINLLGAVAEHLTTITQLLSEARPTRITRRLYGLASENASILGRIFDEIYEFDLASRSYAFALKMAQEIHDNDLWAAGAVRLSELIIEWGEPQNAHLFIEEAHQKGIQDQRLRVWLSSVEAEIHARAGHEEKFLITWGQAKNITLPESLAHDPYRTGFTPTMVAGYEARSFMWLHQPERALPLLKEQERYPTFIRGRSFRLANQGRVYAQLGDVKKACELLFEALGMIRQTKSLLALQRVYQGRSELNPWKDSADVQELDERIKETCKGLTRVKEQV